MPAQAVTDIASLAAQLRRRIVSATGCSPMVDVEPLEPEDYNAIALIIAELTVTLTRSLEDCGDPATEAAEACEALRDRIKRSLAE